MWPTSPALQTALFLRAALLGGGLAAAFDVLEGLRRALHLKKWGTAVLDVLFCLGGLTAFLLFLLRCTDGRLRNYLVLGLLAGAVLEHGLFSRLLRQLSAAVVHGLQRLAAQGAGLVLWMFSFPRGQ